MARTDVKPSGSLTALKTGQYAALSGLWAFNGAGLLANLANPGTGDVTLQGAASITTDGVGAALSVNGNAANYASTGLTGAALGIGGGSSRTIFARVRPSLTISNNGGFFSYGAPTSYGHVAVRKENAYRYQADFGGDIYTADNLAPPGDVATFVLTYDGSAVRLYANGAYQGLHYCTLATGTANPFDIGRYVYSGPANNLAWDGLIYEIGTIAGVAWSDAEVAAYDAAPTAMLGTATPARRRSVVTVMV